MTSLVCLEGRKATTGTRRPSALHHVTYLPGAHVQTGGIVVAAAGAGQQAVVDLKAVSSVPRPSLLAHAGGGPRARFDTFCLWEGKKEAKPRKPWSSLMIPKAEKDFQRYIRETYLRGVQWKRREGLKSKLAWSWPASGQHECHRHVTGPGNPP